jgi:hypothetical protein
MIASKPIRLGPKAKKKSKGKAKATRPPRQIATIEKPLNIRVKSDPDAVVVVQLQFGYGGLWSAGWLLSTRDLRSEVGADKLDGYTTRELAIVSAVTKMLAAILKQVQSYDEPNPQAEGRLRKLGKDLRDYRARLDRAMKPAATPARLVGEQSGALSNLRVGPYIGGDPAAFARAAFGKNGKAKAENRNKPEARKAKGQNQEPKAATANRHGAYTKNLRLVNIPIRATAKTEATIELAYDPTQPEGTRWHAGYHLEGPLDSVGAGGCFPAVDRDGFPSPAAAIHEIAHRFTQRLEHFQHSGSAASKKRCVMALEDVRRWIASQPLPAGEHASPRPTPLAPRSTALVPIASRSSSAAAIAVSGEAAGPLSAGEKREFAKLELVVAHGAEAFLAVGNALRVIEEKRLYRGIAPSFAVYLRERWDVSTSYAYRQIKAATLAETATPIAAKLGVVLRTESQFRELTALDPDDVPEVLRNVAKRVQKDAQGNRRPTAAELRSAVKEYVTPEDDAHQEATPKAAIAAAAKDVGRGEEGVGRGMFARGPVGIAAGTPGATGSASAVIDVTPRAITGADVLAEAQTGQIASSVYWNGRKVAWGAALNDLTDRIGRMAAPSIARAYPDFRNELAALLETLAAEIRGLGDDEETSHCRECRKAK